jgi:hypothetical protein
VYLLWRPEARITEVKISGVPDATATHSLVNRTLEGKYFGIFPRDSIFLYSEQSVRTAVLEANPALVSLSIKRDSFNSISLLGSPRQAAFIWCGATAQAISTSTSVCYDADVNGFIFAEVTDDMGTSTLLHIFAPVDTASSSAASPLKGSVIGAAHMPNLLEFVKFVEAKNIPVISTYIANDEATLYVSNKTSIRYVLGQEKHAEELATAAFPTLSLLDGSIEYADLRFDGRVYIKKYAEPEVKTEAKQ